MKLLIGTVLAFLAGMLLSLCMDSLGYVFRFWPDESETYMMYFNRQELLFCASLVGILFAAVFIVLYFSGKD